MCLCSVYLRLQHFASIAGLWQNLKLHLRCGACTTTPHNSPATKVLPKISSASRKYPDRCRPP